MTLDEVIKELRKWSKEGWGKAEVHVTCEGWTLLDADADFMETNFSDVPVTGVESALSTNGSGVIIIGRVEPDEVRQRLVDSGWWLEPSSEGEECEQD